MGRLGDNTQIHSQVVIHQPNHVSIGDRTSVAEFVHIWGSGTVSIGDDCLIASHVAIVSVTHDTNGIVFRETNRKAPIEIKDNVWIGAGAILLPGVTLGSGCVVAAGAVVTKDVPSNVVVAGIPAGVLRRTHTREA